jgi:putative effector of murein hydrolase LrgA (UPF0299 family)
MIEMFFTLLGIQLFGAFAGEAFSIPVPGLVIGMLVLAASRPLAIAAHAPKWLARNCDPGRLG